MTNDDVKETLKHGIAELQYLIQNQLQVDHITLETLNRLEEAYDHFNRLARLDAAANQSVQRTETE